MNRAGLPAWIDQAAKRLTVTRGAKHHPFGQGYTRSHERLRRNPGLRADHDRARDKMEMGVFHVVGAAHRYARWEMMAYAPRVIGAMK
jgi:hypothetical protein